MTEHFIFYKRIKNEYETILSWELEKWVKF